MFKMADIEQKLALYSRSGHYRIGVPQPLLEPTLGKHIHHMFSTFYYLLTSPFCTGKEVRQSNLWLYMNDVTFLHSGTSIPIKWARMECPALGLRVWVLERI